MKKEYVEKQELINILEPFIKDKCSEYVKEMIIAKIKFIPGLTEEEIKEIHSRKEI